MYLRLHPDIRSTTMSPKISLVKKDETSMFLFSHTNLYALNPLYTPKRECENRSK